MFLSIWYLLQFHSNLDILTLWQANMDTDTRTHGKCFPSWHRLMAYFAYCIYQNCFHIIGVVLVKNFISFGVHVQHFSIKYSCVKQTRCRLREMASYCGPSGRRRHISFFKFAFCLFNRHLINWSYCLPFFALMDILHCRCWLLKSVSLSLFRVLYWS